MSAWQKESVISQLSTHLRGELKNGRWSGEMPGVIRLANELGVARNTMEAALLQLEHEGLLTSLGPGKGRRIELSRLRENSGLRVAILLGEAADRGLDYLIGLRHEIDESGNDAIFKTESMEELNYSVRRVAKIVTKAEVDAWVLVSPSREISEWFVTQEIPAFALFGRHDGLRMPAIAPDKHPAYIAATRALIDLGHRRIVMMTRAQRRLPEPGGPERAFLETLTEGGVNPTSYNLPDWKETPDGLNSRLEELFRVTPPTALILDRAPFFFAALRFCALRGLRVPGDISLVCADGDPGFDWCRPPISHICWESGPMVKRITQWVDNLSRGKDDFLQTMTAADFVTGGTIGPAAKR